MPELRDRATIEAELTELNRRLHAEALWNDSAHLAAIGRCWAELNALGVEGPTR